MDYLFKIIKGQPKIIPIKKSKKKDFIFTKCKIKI